MRLKLSDPYGVQLPSKERVQKWAEQYKMSADDSRFSGYLFIISDIH